MLRQGTGDARALKPRAALSSRNEMSGPVFEIENDPRSTPVGKWMRRFSIDEVPQ